MQRRERESQPRVYVCVCVYVCLCALQIRDIARKMPNTVLNRGYTEHILTWVHSRHK